MAATRVFISYSHDSPEHMDRVLKLSNRLHSEGVDCDLDQYQESPHKGWPREKSGWQRWGFGAGIFGLTS